MRRLTVKFKMADREDDEAFLYGNDGDEKKLDPEEELNDARDKTEKAEESKENIKPEEKQPTENGVNKATTEKEDDDAKEAGELSNEDDEDEDDDDDDDDDVQVTIDEINTSGTGYGTPYATPVNWNFKGSAVGSATKGAVTPAAGSKHLDLNAEGTVNGVGIYEFDLESAEERPWRKPGADITDYFNYGFTEDTWKQYCEKQRRMRLELSMQKKIFAHHAGAPAPSGQTEIASVLAVDARTRKAGPPPERRLEGSIDVIGAVGSRVESRRHQDEDMLPPHMMPDGMSKRGFPGGPPMFNVSTSDPSMGPPQHIPGGPPTSSMAGPPPMHQGVPPRFPPGGPPGAPGMPGMLPPNMQQPPPGMAQPPVGFPPDSMPHDSMAYPGRNMGRGRGRGFAGHHPGMPGMPPPGEFPPGMDERGPRIPFEDGLPHFYPGDAVQPFPPMMGPPPHGIPWEAGMGRGFMPNFRDQFPVGMPRPGGESPGRGGRSDEDSEYGSSEDDRRREREHKKRDKEKDRERSREHRERTRERHSDRDRSPRRERDRDRRDRDRESRRHRDRDKDRDKGSDRDREKREERSSRRERSKEQREKKRHKGSSEVQDGQEEGEVVTKRKSRRNRESKQAEAKQEPIEQEEGQLSSP